MWCAQVTVTFVGIVTVPLLFSVGCDFTVYTLTLIIHYFLHVVTSFSAIHPCVSLTVYQLGYDVIAL